MPNGYLTAKVTNASSDQEQLIQEDFKNINQVSRVHLIICLSFKVALCYTLQTWAGFGLFGNLSARSS